jgi:C4-dicarboxylate transporter DctM subunit
MTELIGLIGLAIAFVFVFLRMPIAFAFGIVGFAGIYYFKGLTAAYHTLYTIPFSYMSDYVWTTIPLFVLLGYIAMHSELTEEFYSGVRAWIGHLRGGLIGAIILGNAAFGACCGTQIAAACAFAPITLPETRKYGYDDSFTIGAIAGSSNLSALIPPSFGAIIFGALTSTSIGKLFIGGIFPGLILIVFFFVITYIMVRRNPSLAPAGPKASWREKTRGITGMWILVLLFGVIIGGLYVGLFTPVEAAGVGTMLVFLLGLIRRKLSWEGLKKALVETGLISAMVFFLLIGCSIFNVFLVVAGAQNLITVFLTSITQSPVGLLLLFSAVFLLLGTFLDVAALVVLLLPIIFPMAVNAGIDPVHFGIVLGVAAGIGLISPPFGIVIYSLSGVVRDVPLFTMFRGAFPFLMAMVFLIIPLVFFPEIVLFLPSKMIGG